MPDTAKVTVVSTATFMLGTVNGAVTEFYDPTGKTYLGWICGFAGALIAYVVARLILQPKG